jgi:hypothetical protein
MEVKVQPARQPSIDRGMAAHSPRGSAATRTVARFSGERAATPTASAISTSQRALWHRPELLGWMALAALAGTVVGAPSFDAGMRPCRTEPAVLASAAEVAAKMTVAHNAACAIWTKVRSASIDDVEIATPPRHGTLALRGRSGVTYRPAPQFAGNDFFAFTLRGHADARDNMSFVRVSVTVK